MMHICVNEQGQHRFTYFMPQLTLVCNWERFSNIAQYIWKIDLSGHKWRRWRISQYFREWRVKRSGSIIKHFVLWKKAMLYCDSILHFGKWPHQNHLDTIALDGSVHIQILMASSRSSFQNLEKLPDHGLLSLLYILLTNISFQIHLLDHDGKAAQLKILPKYKVNTEGEAVGGLRSFHSSDVTWASWPLKSPTTWVFLQKFVNTGTNKQSPLHQPFVKEIYRSPMDSLSKSQ